VSEVISLERKPFEQRFEELKEEFQTWEPTAKDLSKFIDPERGFFTGMQPNKGTSIDFKTLLDETPTLSARTFGAGMQAGINSPGRIWAKFGLPDPDMEESDPVRMWLDQVQHRMFTIMARSNYYEMCQSNYEELGVFNTGAGLIDEDYKNVISCRPFTAGEYYLGAGPDGQIDTFARTVWFTVSQLVKKFGYDSVSSNVQVSYDTDKTQEWLECRHVIKPNEQAIAGLKDSRNMPYISVYWEVGSPQDTFLRISGYKEFPVTVYRATVIGSNVYGTNGPGRLALGASKELQHATKQEMLGIEKLVNPPVQKSNEIDLVNSLPGGVSTYGGTDQQSMKPLYQVNNPYINEQELRIQRLQNNIKRCFYEDLFLMIAQSSDPVRTAYEISKKYEEKLIQLSPLLERVFSAKRLELDRIFNTANRAGLFPPPPPQLRGIELKIEFISSLAQAQKMIEMTPIEQTAAYIGSLVSVYPAVADKFNAEESVDQYASMAGVSPKIIRSDDQVAQIRKERNDAAQKQAILQNTMQLAQGAKTLSQTDMGGNNALNAIINGPDAIANGGG
jgi:hypothetical protein